MIRNVMGEAELPPGRLLQQRAKPGKLSINMLL
jgi:hypothetical protein